MSAIGILKGDVTTRSIPVIALTALAMKGEVTQTQLHLTPGGMLDATLVRMVIAPATMELLGERNWWIPKWLDRLLPHIEIERCETSRAEPVR